MNLELGNEGKCDALNEQTPCLTGNHPGSNFLSNMFPPLPENAISFLIVELQSFAITQPTPWAVRALPSQLADLSVSCRIRQKCFLFRGCSSEDGSSPRKSSTLASKGLSATLQEAPRQVPSHHLLLGRWLLPLHVHPGLPYNL